jgi:RsiW-degrading membrane proteinase PrsW (M82 family)
MLGLVVALLGTLLPTVFYVLFVWWLDRFEKEPLWLLALAFVWGAGPAAILSIIFELIVAVPISALGGGGPTATFLKVSIGAPMIEESFKGIALIGLVLLFYREFDDVLDGIVYGAMIGFGFAFTENLFTYLNPILTGDGMHAGPLNVFMRTVVFGVNHGFWTGVTGAAMGYARLSRAWHRRLLIPIGGWSLAVLLHSIHNIATSMVGQSLCLALSVGLLVNWGGVLLLLLVASSSLRREARWIQQGLAEEVDRGALTPQEFELLSAPSKRLLVQWQAYRRGGRSASRSVGRYYQSATELAFRKRHLRSLADESENLPEIEQLRDQLANSRARAWPWLTPA